MHYFRHSKTRLRTLVICVIVAAMTGCDGDDEIPKDAIVIGAILPFSGEQAAVGLNIEQAVSLAIADINKAGGIDGRSVRLITRDSNSGSAKGYEQAKALLEKEKIKYLIGPEENSLAKTLVPDIKAYNVLNLLPGLAAPIIKETGDKGAWIRLAPSPDNVGCAMAVRAIQEGHVSAATIVSSDDYQTLLATSFNTHFNELGGTSVGSLIVTPGQHTYIEELSVIQELHADVSVMMMYPPTAALMTQEWVIAGPTGNWYLSPTLHTDEFLQNTPFEAVNGFQIFSPSQSLSSECSAEDNTVPEALTCETDNSTKFSKHYNETWQQDHPLSTSVYYYDAVILWALALQQAIKEGSANPEPIVLRSHIREIAEPPGEEIGWSNIEKGLKAVANGEDIAYIGAAAEYLFDTQGGTNYGVTNHTVIDLWSIKDSEFDMSKSIGLICMGSPY